MRVCISRKSFNFKWTKGGEDIAYKYSHINRQSADGQQTNGKTYYMLSFTYEFPETDDKTFFSYSFPYDFSMLSQFIASSKLAIKA